MKTFNERIEQYRIWMRSITTDADIQKLFEMGFFDAPASTKYHNAYAGGLFDHSLGVTQQLVKLTKDNHLEWRRPQSPIIIGMFHDLCKCDQYTLQNDGTYKFNEHTLLRGHGEKSVILAQQFLELTMEEIACIRYHMGAFTDKEEWSAYTDAIHRFKNVLWTHQADMLASHVDETPFGK